jgi:hypothetical protein
LPIPTERNPERPEQPGPRIMSAAAIPIIDGRVLAFSFAFSIVSGPFRGDRRLP